MALGCARPQAPPVDPHVLDAVAPPPVSVSFGWQPGDVATVQVRVPLDAERVRVAQEQTWTVDTCGDDGLLAVTRVGRWTAHPSGDALQDAGAWIDAITPLTWCVTPEGVLDHVVDAAGRADHLAAQLDAWLALETVALDMEEAVVLREAADATAMGFTEAGVVAAAQRAWDDAVGRWLGTHPQRPRGAGAPPEGIVAVAVARCPAGGWGCAQLGDAADGRVVSLRDTDPFRPVEAVADGVRWAWTGTPAGRDPGNPPGADAEGRPAPP